MRDIPADMIIDCHDTGVGAYADLFEVDLQKFGGDVVRFHGGVNGFYGDVIWKGVAYPAYPIQADGFEMKTSGVYSRPTLTVANVNGLITGINADFDDCLGATVTRRQVPVKALDAVNFPNGNPDADPSHEVVSRWVIEEMPEDLYPQITYTLASVVDSEAAMVPGRTILADVCQWIYRGDGCEYDGPAVADERDSPTGDLSVDKCSHKQTGCRLRYPKPAALRMSCFKGCSKVS